MGLLLGYDIGSSSIKATLMDGQTGEVLASATSPEKELRIIAKKPGWAEQDPQEWWENVKAATELINTRTKFNLYDVQAIGIAYQMHGLVAVDKDCEVLRPAIIWCDSRTVEIGERAADDIGRDKCLKRLLNLPGNFTASKLKWVMENEPQIYSKIHKIMMPGDYIVMKMTGEVTTTAQGLSEGMMWDFEKDRLADFVFDRMGISADMIAKTVPAFSVQGELSAGAAGELGLRRGTKVTYRGGDQPNNALSLGLLQPGQIGVTAGTSGVVCAVTDKKIHDEKSRVNTFLHVNHLTKAPRYVVLLCLSGAGVLNSWMKHCFGDQDGDSLTYEQMNELAWTVPIGSDGLVILPFGNGSERTLENRNIGASVHGWNFNIHKKAHFFRAGQEGIVFGLKFGLSIFNQMGIKPGTIRAGAANMFLSPLFCEAFAATTQTVVELYNTDGSQGAARGAGIGADIYQGADEAFVGLKPVKTIRPDEKLGPAYRRGYKVWESILKYQLGFLQK